MSNFQYFWRLVTNHYPGLVNYSRDQPQFYHQLQVDLLLSQLTDACLVPHNYFDDAYLSFRHRLKTNLGFYEIIPEFLSLTSTRLYDWLYQSYVTPHPQPYDAFFRTFSCDDRGYRAYLRNTPPQRLPWEQLPLGDQIIFQLVGLGVPLGQYLEATPLELFMRNYLAETNLRGEISSDWVRKLHQVWVDLRHNHPETYAMWNNKAEWPISEATLWVLVQAKELDVITRVITS